MFCRIAAMVSIQEDRRHGRRRRGQRRIAEPACAGRLMAAESNFKEAGRLVR
jgi:hypothetical protein